MGSGADHDPVGQPRDEAAAHHGQDQRQRRRDAGEVRLCGRRGGDTDSPQLLVPPEAFNNAEVQRFERDYAAEGSSFFISQLGNSIALLTLRCNLIPKTVKIQKVVENSIIIDNSQEETVSVQVWSRIVITSNCFIAFYSSIWYFQCHLSFNFKQRINESITIKNVKKLNCCQNVKHSLLVKGKIVFNEVIHILAVSFKSQFNFNIVTIRT